MRTPSSHHRASQPAVEELTDGRGADVAYEASGHPEALQQAINCTGKEGTIVVISYYGHAPLRWALAGVPPATPADR